MATEQELIERIRQLEAENSELRDKLDMIYAIVAPDDDGASDQEGATDDDGGDLVQIGGVN